MAQFFESSPPPPYREYVDGGADSDHFQNWRKQAFAAKDKSVAGQILNFDYQNAKGERSSRQVKLSFASTYKGKYYIQAYCYLRCRSRTFNMESMQDVVLVGTGEVFDNGLMWMHEYARALLAPAFVATPIREWRQDRRRDKIERRQWTEYGPRLTLLAYLARFDGTICGGEKWVFQEFMDAVALDIEPADRRTLVKKALALFPSKDDAERALIGALKGGRPMRKFMVESAQKIGAIDRSPSAEKLEMVAFLKKLLG